jgi:flagellar biogenesis protein FliO
MDEIRQALAVLTVLGILGGALWWLRRKGLAQFSLNTRSGRRVTSMKVVERLVLTPQHSLHLVRVGERTILVAASPGGCAVLDSVTATPSEGQTCRPNT